MKRLMGGRSVGGTRVIALAAVLALAASLAACGPRGNRGGDTVRDAPAVAGALDELEALLLDIDAALAEADAHAHADDDGTPAAPARLAPAGAAAPAPGEATLDGLKDAVTARIDLRLAALRRERAAASDARALTDPHRAALITIIDGASDGLRALRARVADETSVAALRADAKRMVEDYRVFALVGPQVRLTIAGDAAARAIERARRAHERLTDAVQARDAGGKDTTQAEADLAEMAAAIDRAEAALDGRVETLLAIEPGPDGASIANRVAAVRRSLGACRSELRTAVAEGRAVLRALR